jgi:hypothetical protein
VTRISDFSGDGRTDVLARDHAGKLWLYPGNSNGLLGGRTPNGAGWNGMTALVAPGSFDRTGGNDLMARDSAGMLYPRHR